LTINLIGPWAPIKNSRVLSRGI